MYEGDYLSNSISPYSPAKRNPNLSFTANPTSGLIIVPQNVTLTWSSDLGVSASIDQGIGPVALNGSIVVPLVILTTIWTFTVTKLDGTTVQTQATYTAL